MLKLILIRRFANGTFDDQRSRFVKPQINNLQQQIVIDSIQYLLLGIDGDFVIVDDVSSAFTEVGIGGGGLNCR